LANDIYFSLARCFLFGPKDQLSSHHQSPLANPALECAQLAKAHFQVGLINPPEAV